MNNPTLNYRQKDRAWRIKMILEILANTYPSAESELNFTSPFECLIATILSAQCTDQRVNSITASLFQEIRGPADLVLWSEKQLQDRISSCNYFKTKSRHILATCQELISNHGGKVPSTRESLMTLPGVGRKTANVVLSNAFGIPAIAVDTHVFRVTKRLGLAEGDKPEQLEQELMKVIPERDWSSAHHWLILHGRRICHARKPSCDNCHVSHLCPSSTAAKSASPSM